jgi:cytochrome c5
VSNFAVTDLFKKVLVAASSFLIIFFAAYAEAGCKKHTLEERISPVGSVCVEGEECKADVVEVADAAPKAARSGSEIAGDYCLGCHQTGVMNAPKTGSTFKDLASKGMPELLKVAKKGKNAMPRKGGCGDCSDDELSAAIQHMIDM